MTALPLRAKTGLVTLALSSLPRISTCTSSPICTPMGRRASAMDCCSVGEKEPEVISPSPWAVTTFWWPRSTPLSSRIRPRNCFCWPLASSADLPTKSRSSLMATVQARPASSGEAVGGDAGILQLVPQAFGLAGRQHDFVAVLAGVAGAGDEILVDFGGEEGFQAFRGGLGLRQHLPDLGAGVRALHGDDA